MTDKKILFFGTPEFAKEILSALVEDDLCVIGAVAQPDKLKGRGMKNLSFCPVKEYAIEHSIPVYQPETLKDGTFENILNELAPDVIVVAAYGKILPPYIIEYPKFGCINVHGSLLPEYRGAAPVQRAIIDGKEITGITTMLMDNGLDTGEMLLKEEIKIHEDMNSAELFEEMSTLGKKLITETLSKIFDGTITKEKQDESKATYAKKLTSEESHINWNDTAKSIHNKIRGFAPYVECFSLLNDKKLKIVKSSLSEKCEFEDGDICGKVISLTKKAIFVKCSDGVLALSLVKPEGKGAMTPADMINGRKISVGDILG